MRRTELKRKTPLRARGNTKYRNRVRDVPYMLDVKKLRCAVRAYFQGDFNLDPAVVFDLKPTLCCGRVQADHAGVRNLGYKAPDDTCIPLCMIHHDERTSYVGAFKNWKGPQMRAWLDIVIAHTQREVAQLRSRRTA